MKIFVTDLDGTLLNKRYQSDEIIQACVQRVVDHQNRFVVATGRSIHGCAKLPFIKNVSDLIVMNGAIILDKNMRIIKETMINRMVIEAIYERYPKGNVEYISGKHIYMTISKEAYLQAYRKWDIWNAKLGDAGALENHLSIYRFDCQLKDIQNIVKINILELDENNYQEKEAFLHRFDSYIQNQPFDPRVLEITDKHTSKLYAIKYLCEKYHWDMREVYVFGDGNNDVEMLKYFEHSYAPKDASREAILAARETIGANRDYGVSEKIISLLIQ